MDQASMVESIGNTLTQLDALLTNPATNNNPGQWQQLYALRKHLDDQQRALVQQTIASDDSQFQTLAGSIQAATTQLNNQIADMTKVASTISLVSQISASLDQVLKIV